MMTHPAATAAAAAASDESTESLFETQQQSGEGSEESVPPPPPLQPTISSSRKEPSAATTTTAYLQEDGTDDNVAQQLMGSIREEEYVREMILNAPWIPPNNRSPAHGGGNGGGPDHHRVRFAVDRNNDTVVNCEMSSISAKAASGSARQGNNSILRRSLRGPRGCMGYKTPQHCIKHCIKHLSYKHNPDFVPVAGFSHCIIRTNIMTVSLHTLFRLFTTFCHN